jgi:hypothetical protein
MELEIKVNRIIDGVHGWYENLDEYPDTSLKEYFENSLNFYKISDRFYKSMEWMVKGARDHDFCTSDEWYTFDESIRILYENFEK